MDRAFVSKTRRGYFPVGSAPASLLATVSETKARSMPLERSPFLRHLCLGVFERFKPGLVGQQCRPTITYSGPDPYRSIDQFLARPRPVGIDAGARARVSWRGRPIRARTKNINVDSITYRMFFVQFLTWSQVRQQPAALLHRPYFRPALGCYGSGHREQ